MFTQTHSMLQTGTRERGVSLIEMVVFIVVISVAATGVLMMTSLNSRHSADPLRQKQALAIADALMEEIQLMPFTDCDPDGINTIPSTCVSETASLGPEPGEARGGAATPFDNVNDYEGFSLNGSDRDLGNDAEVTVPNGYKASVRVTKDAAFGPAGSALPVDAVLRIAVTVTYADNGSVVVEGYRTKYAPDVTP